MRQAPVHVVMSSGVSDPKAKALNLVPSMIVMRGAAAPQGPAARFLSASERPTAPRTNVSFRNKVLGVRICAVG